MTTIEDIAMAMHPGNLHGAVHSAVSLERERCTLTLELCRAAGVPERGAEFITRGISLAQVRDELAKRGSGPDLRQPPPAPSADPRQDTTVVAAWLQEKRAAFDHEAIRAAALAAGRTH